MINNQYKIWIPTLENMGIWMTEFPRMTFNLWSSSLLLLLQYYSNCTLQPSSGLSMWVTFRKFQNNPTPNFYWGRGEELFSFCCQCIEVFCFCFFPPSFLMISNNWTVLFPPSLYYFSQGLNIHSNLYD